MYYFKNDMYQLYDGHSHKNKARGIARIFRAGEPDSASGIICMKMLVIHIVFKSYVSHNFVLALWSIRAQKVNRDYSLAFCTRVVARFFWGKIPRDGKGLERNGNVALRNRNLKDDVMFEF